MHRGKNYGMKMKSKSKSNTRASKGPSRGRVKKAGKVVKTSKKKMKYRKLGSQ